MVAQSNYLAVSCEAGREARSTLSVHQPRLRRRGRMLLATCTCTTTSTSRRVGASELNHVRQTQHQRKQRNRFESLRGGIVLTLFACCSSSVQLLCVLVPTAVHAFTSRRPTCLYDSRVVDLQQRPLLSQPWISTTTSTTTIVANNDFRDLALLEPQTTVATWADATTVPSPSSRTRRRDGRDADRRIKAFFTGKHRATALEQGIRSVKRGRLEVSKEDASSSDDSAADLFNNDNNNENATETPEAPICRVVALSDSKLPTSALALPVKLRQPPHVLRRLDDLYHAMAHDETRRLKYLDTSNRNGNDDEAPPVYEPREEKELVSVTRKSLEDAGFKLLSRRDLDLCEALNAGYLLRLSIEPDVSELDPCISREFYPERFDSKGKPLNEDELLFDGRVLVFRRGYSQEVTKGRLLLPKIDYLQASLVQRSASWLKRRVNDIEERVSIKVGNIYRRAASASIRKMRSTTDRIQNKRLANVLRKRIPKQTPDKSSNLRSSSSSSGSGSGNGNGMSPGSFIKLSRYGGSKLRFGGSPDPMDALNPFLICESPEGTYCPPCPMKRIKKVARLSSDLVVPSTPLPNGSAVSVNGGDSYYDCGFFDAQLKCAYDVGILGPDLKRPSMQLLERVTIGNLVNVFSSEGRRKLFRTIFSKSELVEPTYEEVVVVWRPLPHEKKKKRINTPKIVYELADMFDVEELPEPLKKKKEPLPSPLEIRTFDGVPMANVAAVLPKTKLVFRPADAFVFDLVAFTSFLLVVGSQRFDSPKLDLLAIVSGSLWLLRTVLRYSNKLARYDLLVKTFLTSKISHRNAGAIKYIGNEAGSQRATRAALVHSWLVQKKNKKSLPSRAHLVRDGNQEVNELIRVGDGQQREIPIDIDAALNDLEDLELVQCTDDQVEVVRDSNTAISKLKRAWDTIFDGRMSLQDLVGRPGRADDAAP